MLHICILAILITLAQSACPAGRYQQNGVCVPPTSTICPLNSAYSNGICRYRTDYLCNGGNVYNSGVCARYSSDAACKQTPLQCVQPTPCSSTNYNECPYGQVCPQNLVMYGGRCVTQSIAQCPTGTQLQSGHCVRPTVCPKGSVNQRGSCAPTVAMSPQYQCPPNSHRVDGTCVQDNNVICPAGSDFINGECVRDHPCMPGTFEYNGVCAQCPVNSTYINGDCVHCLPGMILRNGRCFCKPGQTLLGEECVYFKNITCSDNDIFTEGKCIPPYCYGNRCCSDSICNLCFLRCEKDNNDVSSLSTCQSKCVDTKQINYKIPELTTRLNNTKLNVTNLVNSTNSHSVATKSNNTNGNNVNLQGITHSGFVKTTTDNKTTSYQIETKKEDEDENCCIIISPKRCVNMLGKYKCYQSKKHSCGDECIEKPLTTVSPMLIYPPRPQHRFMYPYQRQYPQFLMNQPQNIKEVLRAIKEQTKVTQEPQVTKKPIIIQQPQVLQQPQIIQQPQVLQPQIIQQPQVYQQPYYSYYYQQPQIYSQSHYQLFPHQIYSYQQPEIIRQPYAIQPQFQIPNQGFQSRYWRPQVGSEQSASEKNSSSKCTYKKEWPYVECST